MPDRPALRHAIRDLEALAAQGRDPELADRMKELARSHLQPESVAVVP